MKRELEKKLEEKYQFMKKAKTYKQQIESGGIYDLYGAFGCDVGDGWYGLLDEMCAKIQNVYDENGKSPDIIIDQVKEKYGTLRFYYHFAGHDPAIHAFDIIGKDSLRIRPGKGDYTHEKIDRIVAWGEEESGKICEDCGKSGVLRLKQGYYLTLCEDCSRCYGS